MNAERTNSNAACGNPYHPNDASASSIRDAAPDLLKALTGGAVDPSEIQTVGPLSWLRSAIDALTDLDRAKADRDEDPDAFSEMIQELRCLVDRGEAAVAKASQP